MWLLALAIAPGLAICIHVFYRDAKGREPSMNLIMSFIWGMLATVPATLIEYGTQGFRYNTIVGIIFSAFILTALVEESCKFLALRYYSIQRISFDEPLDGIVYGVMVSMGFATIENIFYVIEWGMPTAMARIYTAIPAHASFGVIMGYYAGLARFDHSRRKNLYFKSVAMATMLHGIYDFFLFINQDESFNGYIPRAVSELLFFAGALATLTISVIFSRRLLRMHRLTSKRLNQATPVLTIRLASENDIELIRTLTLQIWPQTYASILSQEQIRYMMDLMYNEKVLRKQMQEHHQFIIVYNAGVPIGFASYGEIEPGIFKLHKIYLLQKQQGRGSGKFVIDHIIKDIRIRGAVALQLNVNRNNPAKGFYEKIGFEVIRTEDIDIGNGYYMNDYVMESRISQI